MIYTNAAQQCLNEAYLGKTPELLEMEKQLGKFRKKYRNNYFPRLNPSVDPEVLKFNRMMENFLGLDTFALMVVPSSIQNAFTMPLGYKMDIEHISGKSVIDKKHFKFKKEAGYCMTTNFYSGLIFNPEYTNGEILGVLLHEIGHNFTDSINSKIQTQRSILKYVSFVFNILGACCGQLQSILNILNSYNSYTNTSMKAYQGIPQTDFYHRLITFISNISGTIGDTVISIYYIMSIVSVGSIDIIGTIVNCGISFLLSPMGYMDESLSDAFSTYYGYGPEIISALGKMESGSQGIATKELISEIPILAPLVSLTSIPQLLLSELFDEHPSYLSRLNAQINQLKKDINKGCDPKVKSLIMKDINNLEKSRDRFINDKSSKIKDINFAKHAWWKICNFFKFDPKREILAPANSIVNQYDDFIDRKEKIKRGVNI